MSPSPPKYTIVRSISALYRNSAITAEAILDAENAIARKPASRGTSSSCGSDRNVTDALKMTAAYTVISDQVSQRGDATRTTRHAQALTISIGPAL